MKYRLSFLWLFVLEVCCFDMIFQQCSFDRIHYIKAYCNGLSFYSFISKYQQQIATPLPHFYQYAELRPTYDECPQTIRIDHYCVKLIWCVEANGWLVYWFLCLSGLLLEMYPLLASDGIFHVCFFVVHPPLETAIMTPWTNLPAFHLSDIQPTPPNGSMSLRNQRDQEYCFW